MIPVQIQPEPESFADRVRKPGRDFLKRLVRKPTNKDFRKHWHWNRISPELYQAYDGICAYSAHSIPSGTQQASVDHFIPRSCSPDLAYEWSNYRLAMESLGNHKGKTCEVVDPFYIKHDWFILNFATFQIEPSSDLPRYLKRRIKKTIEILRLNTDNNLVSTRIGILEDFAKNVYPLSFLERRYPFIAYELKRQKMEANIKEIFNKRLPTL